MSTPIIPVATVALLALLTGCTPGVPANVKPVTNFDPNRYVGDWYEIARLENRFEKGLDHVTATYRVRPDGGLTVINRGFDPKTGNWREATGKAYLTGAPNEGRLKVSFFGPFYGAYNVIALDENYQWSLVCGDDHSLLWILSRTPELPASTLEHLTNKARSLGFATEKLIHVNQK